MRPEERQQFILNADRSQNNAAPRQTHRRLSVAIVTLRAAVRRFCDIRAAKSVLEPMASSAFGSGRFGASFGAGWREPRVGRRRRSGRGLSALLSTSDAECDADAISSLFDLKKRGAARTSLSAHFSADSVHPGFSARSGKFSAGPNPMWHVPQNGDE